MSLISSDLSDTLRRFAIMEFFFFNVRFLALFGVSSSSSHSSRKCRVAGILLTLNVGEANGEDADTGTNGTATVGAGLVDFALSASLTAVVSFACGWRLSVTALVVGTAVGIGGSIERRGRGGGAGGVL